MPDAVERVCGDRQIPGLQRCLWSAHASADGETRAHWHCTRKMYRCPRGGFHRSRAEAKRCSGEPVRVGRPRRGDDLRVVISVSLDLADALWLSQQPGGASAAVEGLISAGRAIENGVNHD